MASLSTRSVFGSSLPMPTDSEFRPRSKADRPGPPIPADLQREQIEYVVDSIDGFYKAG